jgi:hypothetical protein
MTLALDAKPSANASCRWLQDVGIDPGQPEILDIHNIIRR